MSTLETLLLALCLILALPYLLWRLGRMDYYAPLVVVQIVCGIVLGPGLLGAAFPAYYRFLFNPEVVGALNGIASWAVLLFVWLAGLELDLGMAWRARRESLVTAGFALGVPMVLGAGVGVVLLLQDSAWLGKAGAPWQFMTGIGMACAVTALPILVLLMEKLGILRSALGQRVLRYASLDDIAIWAVLALILMDWERLGRQALFLAVFSGAAAFMRRLMPRLAQSDRWYVALIWLAACSFAGDWSGLHAMVGGFLAGLVLDARWFGEERLDGLRQNLLLNAMPVFFLSTGLKTQWNVGGMAVFGAATLLLIACVGGKLIGLRVAGKLLGWAPGDASLIGWLLQTKALIMIIFANILMDRQIISPDTFTALLLMAVASTMLTIPKVAPRLERAEPIPVINSASVQ